MVLSSNWIVCHPAVVWVVGEALLDVGLENLRQRDVLNGVWKALPNECACFGGWGRGGGVLFILVVCERVAKFKE